MAARSSQDPHNDPYLSPAQKDLLLAALNAQAAGQQQQQQQQPPHGRTGAASITTATTTTTTNTKSTTRASPHDAAPPVMPSSSATADALFMSPQQSELDTSFGADYTPDLDYLDGDSFDFDNADLGGEMIGALPGSGAGGLDHHEKRKNSSEDDTEEGDAKRRETREGEKSAKKPGRKPLTNEPTTKRKAQNRAAQRAFRERKEKHLKDLETQVSELTRKKEADKHENGLLRAQVERLQVELREYRKRLSLHSTSGAGRSPPLSALGSGGGNQRNNTNFHFDFPKFGALPGSQMFGAEAFSQSPNASSTGNSDGTTPPTTVSPVTNGGFSGSGSGPTPSYVARHDSAGRSLSPMSVRSGGASHVDSPSQQVANFHPSFAAYSSQNNMHGFVDTLPQMGDDPGDPFGDLFSPSILRSASLGTNGSYFGGGAAATNVNGGDNTTGDSNGGDSTAGLNRVFRFNDGTGSGSSTGTSDSTASPGSSTNWNATGNSNSSCCTSPEPSHASPAQKSQVAAEAFCDKLTPASVGSGPTTATAHPLSASSSDPQYSVPSLDTFDPLLFTDYRDPQNMVDMDPEFDAFGNGALGGVSGGSGGGGGFFGDALLPPSSSVDLVGSPSSLFGILQSPIMGDAALPGAGADNVAAQTPSRNLLAEVERRREGDEEAAEEAKEQKTKEGGAKKLISCNNIWNQLQSNPAFQQGDFDLDLLCSELRSKARCSESGVLVDQRYVDAALRKLGKKGETFPQAERNGTSDTAAANAGSKTNNNAGPMKNGAGAGGGRGSSSSLMFEQESWDDVLKKLGGVSS